ncbi:hypothetical protein TorRG33x02_329200 [Trema orientale]|uniref:Uncharacterized protein n=1 Tax=Trema orientale TaxID=63057 RepID=A0A2P5B8Z9_TREOI|nr:hypothetical protein TorRG33x02_329200 [Trema orientale]
MDMVMSSLDLESKFGEKYCSIWTRHENVNVTWCDGIG